MSDMHGITRAGQRVKLTQQKATGRWIGHLPGYPYAPKAGWTGDTWWKQDGTHCLCRCDDLVRISPEPIPLSL